MTALDRISVRRTLLYLERSVREIVRWHLTCGTSLEWLEERIILLLAYMAENKAIYDSWWVIEDGQMLIGIQPKPTAEWISIELEVEKRCTAA